jgi:hypothetical protein
MELRLTVVLVSEDLRYKGTVTDLQSATKEKFGILQNETVAGRSHPV